MRLRPSHLGLAGGLELPMSKTFADLGVPAELVAVLDKQGITAPFEVQAASIPDALNVRVKLSRLVSHSLPNLSVEHLETRGP